MVFVKQKILQKTSYYVNPYVRKDVIATIIKCCRGEKTRGIKAIDGFRKKLMIPDSEIPKCPEFEVKSNIGKIFKKYNPMGRISKNILLRFIKLILIFINIRKKIQVKKMGVNVFYLELMFNLIIFYQQQNLMKKDILTEILFLRKKDKKHQKKKLGCKFIRINTSNAKNGYDLDYEVGNIEAFFDEFKNKKINKLEDRIKEKEEKSNEKIKELEAKIKGLEDKNKNSAANQITNNFEKIIIKNW